MVPDGKYERRQKKSPKHTHTNLFSIKGENLCPYESELFYSVKYFLVPSVYFNILGLYFCFQLSFHCAFTHFFVPAGQTVNHPVPTTHPQILGPFPFLQIP